jgi:hypothetical protein
LDSGHHSEIKLGVKTCKSTSKHGGSETPKLKTWLKNWLKEPAEGNCLT